MLLCSVLLLIPNTLEPGIFTIGVGVGAALGFQILFINDVALPEYRAQLALTTPFTVALGTLIGYGLRQALGNAHHHYSDLVYSIYCVTLVPVVVALVSIAFWVWEPPLTYLLRADEGRALDSAQHYHPPKSIITATMDTFVRLRAKVRALAELAMCIQDSHFSQRSAP